MKTVCRARCSQASEALSQKPVEGQFSRTQDFSVSAGSEQTEPSKINAHFAVLFDTWNLTEAAIQ